MGIARDQVKIPPKPAEKAATKPRKPRAKKGGGDWVQVNLRLHRDEYNLFVTAAKERDTTAPGLAKMLVDEYMKGWGRPNNRPDPEWPVNDENE